MGQNEAVSIPFPAWAAPGEDADLRRKVAACERLVQAALNFCDHEPPLRKSISGPPPDGAQVMPLAVFDESARAIKNFRACVQLASTGFGQPAQIIAGVVLQSALIIMWAVEYGEASDSKAELHARFGLQKDLESRRQLGFWKSLPESDYLSEADQQDVSRLFGVTTDGLWTGHSNITEIINELAVNAEDEFEGRVYKALEVMLNSSSSAARGTGLANQSYRVVRQMPNGQPAMSVNVGMGTEACVSALHIAVMGMLPALKILVKHYTPDLAEEIRRCEGLLWRAWKDTAVLRQLSDDDPCPCDRPGTQWADCHKWTNELGTVRYASFTDADLINFTPYDPKDYKGHIELPNHVETDVPNGPVILTFTFRLPFTLGLLDEGGHTFTLEDSWADPDDIAHFGRVPIVLIRLCNVPSNGLELWPKGASEAIRHFYGDVENPPTSEQWSAIDGAYEQWVTVETPSGRLSSENSDDPAYAFHRALAALNTFLTALDLAESDHRISSVTTLQIGAIVFRGAWQEGEWTRLGDLIMHIESFPFPLEPRSMEELKPQVDSAFNDIHGGRLFLRSNLWHGRAIRALQYRGDYPDFIVSIQTACESMIYDLMRGILVDEEKTLQEITSYLNGDRPYKILLTDMSKFLGGNWNLQGSGPIGRYWKSIYLVRNRVVHAAYSPTASEVDEALKGFFAIREYISVALWRKHRKYPRTLLAKVGVNGLERRGWLTKWIREEYEAYKAEPHPFYWPKDIAGR